MLPITLEPQKQIDLFPKFSSDADNFDYEIVNKGINAEIRLYFLTIKNKKAVRRTRKRFIPKQETSLF